MVLGASWPFGCVLDVGVWVLRLRNFSFLWFGSPFWVGSFHRPEKAGPARATGRFHYGSWVMFDSRRKRMKRVLTSFAAALAAILVAPALFHAAAFGQSAYTLGITGP